MSASIRYHPRTVTPKVTTVHETVLYGPDIPRLAGFYRDVIGLYPLDSLDSGAAALRLPEGDAVLLLFEPSHAATPGRGVPIHGLAGGRPGPGATAGVGGAGHVAFRVRPGSLPEWEAHLAALKIPIELKRDWPRGGSSIYIRDPAGNSVELVDGRIWPDAG